MKKTIFLLGFSLIAVLILSGCTSVAEVTSPTGSPPPMSTWAPGGTPSPTVFPTSTAALTLEEARAQLAAKGWAAVDTREKASQLAGYAVTVPAYLPSGFAPRVWDRSGIFVIISPGFGVLPPDNNRLLEVDQYYSQDPDPNGPLRPYFILIQSPVMKEMGYGVKEDIVINGHPGKKSLVASSDINSPSRLALYWGDGTVNYLLDGQLISPLDEAALIKVAESVAP